MPSPKKVSTERRPDKDVPERRTRLAAVHPNPFSCGLLAGCVIVFSVVVLISFILFATRRLDTNELGFLTTAETTYPPSGGGGDIPSRRKSVTPTTHWHHHFRRIEARDNSSTTAARPRERRPMVCTVDVGVTDSRVYPPDGVCDYVIFRNVAYEEGGFVAAENESASLAVFNQIAVGSKLTAFGYALDYVSFDFLSDGEERVDLSTVMTNIGARFAVRGLGVLDLTDGFLDEGFNGTLTFFEDHRKALTEGGFLFIGLEPPYNSSQLLRLIRIAKAVDLAILRTHVEFTPESPCVVSFPGAWVGRGESGQKETAKVLSELSNETHAQAPVWLVSFQLGVLAYEGPRGILNAGESCATHYTLGYDDVCREHLDTVVDEQAVVVYQQGKGSGTFRAFETSETLERKVVLFLNIVANSGLRFGVAMFDIQFENYETECSNENGLSRRFARMSTVRDVLDLYTS